MKFLKYILAVMIMGGFITCSTPDYNFFATISGTIIDSNIHSPISGASILLSPSGRNTISNTDGTFEFNDLEAKQYTLTVQINGYSTNRKTINAIAGETTQVSITMQKME